MRLGKRFAAAWLNLWIAAAGLAAAQEAPRPEPVPTPGPPAPEAPAFHADLSKTDQYYFHGVYSSGEAAFPNSFVAATGGSADPRHRPDWNVQPSYTYTPADALSRSVVVDSGASFQTEVRRIAEGIQDEYRRDGRQVFLHGHSAGGVLASAVAKELIARGVGVAGVATYGTPQENLRFHDAAPPADVPVYEFRNESDFVLMVDRSKAETKENVHVTEFDDGAVEGHTFGRNYGSAPQVGQGLQRAADALPEQQEALQPGNCANKSCTLYEANREKRIEKSWQVPSVEPANVPRSEPPTLEDRASKYLGGREAPERPAEAASFPAAGEEAGVPPEAIERALHAVELQERSTAEINAKAPTPSEPDTFDRDFTSRATHVSGRLKSNLDDLDLYALASRPGPSAGVAIPPALPSHPASTERTTGSVGPAKNDHCPHGAFVCPNGNPWPACRHAEKYDCPPAEYREQVEKERKDQSNTNGTAPRAGSQDKRRQ